MNAIPVPESYKKTKLVLLKGLRPIKQLLSSV